MLHTHEQHAVTEWIFVTERQGALTQGQDKCNCMTSELGCDCSAQTAERETYVHPNASVAEANASKVCLY